jgi:hypothetical protein
VLYPIATKKLRPSTQEDSSPSPCLRGLARHFKTEPSETAALFWIPKDTGLRAEADEQTNRVVCRYWSRPPMRALGWVTALCVVFHPISKKKADQLLATSVVSHRKELIQCIALHPHSRVHHDRGLRFTRA